MFTIKTTLIAVLELEIWLFGFQIARAKQKMETIHDSFILEKERHSKFSTEEKFFRFCILK